MTDDAKPADDADTSSDQPDDDKEQTTGRPWPPTVGTLIYAAALLLAVFGLGVVLGAFVIGGSGTGSPNDDFACSYFWQFQAAPSMPGLVQAALSKDPGAGPGSHYLYEWLNTLEQQVSIPQITLTDLQTDSRDDTAVAISAICQQLGFNAPGSLASRSLMTEWTRRAGVYRA